MESSSANHTKTHSPKPDSFLKPQKLSPTKTMFSSCFSVETESLGFHNNPSTTLLHSTADFQDTNNNLLENYIEEVEVEDEDEDVEIDDGACQNYEEINAKNTGEDLLGFNIPRERRTLRYEVKKTEVVKEILLPYPRNTLPMRFKDHIRDEGLMVHKEVLVMEKALTVTDVNRLQNRLSIPFSQRKNVFLTKGEITHMKTIDNDHKKTRKKLDVDMIDPKKEKWKVKLGIWVMCSKELFAINGSTWFQIVQSNELEQGDYMQLWAIRVGDEQSLCFILVRLAKAARE